MSIAKVRNTTPGALRKVNDSSVVRKGKDEKKQINNNVEDYSLDNSSWHTNLVAQHYNRLRPSAFDSRAKSRILHLRNFNNWIKGKLIGEYLQLVKNTVASIVTTDTSRTSVATLRVLDMCCGKGGDLEKYCERGITHLICVDIASVSLIQCQARYNDIRTTLLGRMYSADFVASDCSTSRLLGDRRISPEKVDLVSCQFAIHYSFESLPQADCWMRNAAESLKEGGYFIGTVPDAEEILKRKRESRSGKFGNEVYSIEAQWDDSETAPLFGRKYVFCLDEVVNCSEFLVHFPTLVELAKRYRLELVSCRKFREFYDDMVEKEMFLETYRLVQRSMRDRGNATTIFSIIKELSIAEWDVASLYLTFAFKKI